MKQLSNKFQHLKCEPTGKQCAQIACVGAHSYYGYTYLLYVLCSVLLCYAIVVFYSSDIICLGLCIIMMITMMAMLLCWRSADVAVTAASLVQCTTNNKPFEIQLIIIIPFNITEENKNVIHIRCCVCVLYTTDSFA